MKIKKFNEEWNPFEKKVNFHMGAAKLIKDLGLPYEEKETVQRYQAIEKDGWFISVKNPLNQGDGKISATIDTAYNGFFVDKDIRVNDLEDYLSNFDFSPKDGKRPLRFAGWGAENHVERPKYMG